MTVALLSVGGALLHPALMVGPPDPPMPALPPAPPPAGPPPVAPAAPLVPARPPDEPPASPFFAPALLAPPILPPLLSPPLVAVLPPVLVPPVLVPPVFAPPVLAPPVASAGLSLPVPLQPKLSATLSPSIARAGRRAWPLRLMAPNKRLKGDRIEGSMRVLDHKHVRTAKSPSEEATRNSELTDSRSSADAR